MNNFEYLRKTEELYEFVELLRQDTKIKREITDVAVSKIPYVVYPDLDVNQSLIIHEFAEYTLAKAKEENEHNEVAVTYDLDNGLSMKDGFQQIIEKAGVCYGGLDETNLFSDTQTMSTIYRAKNIAVVNVHNHPGCSSFSVEDISTFLMESAIKLMVVVGNNGELYYLSKNLPKYNFKEAVRYIAGVSKIIHPDAVPGYKWKEAELRQCADIFLKNSNLFGIEYKHVLGTDLELKKIKESKELEISER